MELKQRIDYIKALPWKRYTSYLFIGLMALAGFIFGYNRLFPDKPIDSTPSIMPEAPQAVKVEKIYIQGPIRWRVYEKEKLSEKIPLSPEVKNNAKIQITDTAKIPDSPYGGTAVAFGNMSSGISGIEYTKNKRTLLGFGGKTEIGAMGGISTRGDVAVIYAGQPIIRIGVVEVGVAAGGGVIGGNGILGGVVKISGNF